MTDTNIELVQKAIETKTEIILIPRRSHTVKGIPIEFDKSTMRIYIDTGKFVESILLSEVGHFAFPKTLYNSNEIAPIKDERPESFTEYAHRKHKEKGGKPHAQ